MVTAISSDHVRELLAIGAVFERRGGISSTLAQIGSSTPTDLRFQRLTNRLTDVHALRFELLFELFGDLG